MDEEDFVSYGTALPPLDDAASLQTLSSKNSLRAQQVRDDRGRQRFHGAFTGGFSAGYFNSVDTKEGWKPSQFSSSKNRKPEDFMDDEDFAEFGIAPKEMTASSQYIRKKDEGKKTYGPSVIPDMDKSLLDLVSPCNSSVAGEVMKSMGWREGQGLGVRVKRKMLSTGGSNSAGNGSLDDFELSFAFAPEDVSPVEFVAKDDFHGIGYSGIDPSLLKGSHSSHVVYAQKSSMTGQAFGVGALEDDDFDIYGSDNLRNYNTELVDHAEESTFGWTAPRGIQPPNKGVDKILSGFTKSEAAFDYNKKFAPPRPPRDFRPLHKMAEKIGQISLSLKKMNANLRSQLLGEKQLPMSVFDLMPEEERTRLKSLRHGESQPNSLASTSGILPASTSTPPVSMSTPPVSMSTLPVSMSTLPASTSTLFASTLPLTVETKQQVCSSVPPEARTSKVAEPQTPTSQAQQEPLFKATNLSALTFKPFAKDPAKQERYQKFLAHHRKGDPNAYEKCISGHMGEWERREEKRQFVRSALLFKPMTTMMASRFTQAKHQDDIKDDGTVEVKVDLDADKDDMKSAAKLRMFGKLTHSFFEWHPHRILCRRFNIANPYPNSVTVGLPTVKKDRVSVYNFLDTDPSPEEATTPAGVDPDHPQSSVTADTGDKETSLTLPSESKPSMDLFKAIFDDDDEEEEEDVGSSGGGGGGGPAESDIKSHHENIRQEGPVSSNSLRKSSAPVSPFDNKKSGSDTLTVEARKTSNEKPDRVSHHDMDNVPTKILFQPAHKRHRSSSSGQTTGHHDNTRVGTPGREQVHADSGHHIVLSSSEEDTYGPALPPPALTMGSVHSSKSHKKHKKHKKHHKHHKSKKH